MPELPEVETTCAGIKPHISGCKLRQVVVRDGRLRWPVPNDLQNQLGNQELHQVARRGKYILLHFGSGALISHLGMSGSMRIVTDNEPAAYHDHFDLVFDHCLLRYRDPRRFGCLLWQANPVMTHPLLAKLGPEPLHHAFDTEHLAVVSKGKKQSIKAFIMDSKNVVGVGNIYANEALFIAGIHPHRQAGRIARARLEKLVGAIKEVLIDAIKRGGTSLRNFVDSDGNAGYFKQQLRVYGREDKACLQCNQPLIKTRLGQRSTVYCKYCQT